MGQQAIALYPNMKDLSGGFIVLKSIILPEGMMIHSDILGCNDVYKIEMTHNGR